jgi:hypothetical protein
MWKKFGKKIHQEIPDCLGKKKEKSNMCRICKYSENCSLRERELLHDYVLCDCVDCTIESKGLFEYLPLENGQWTSCTVHRCRACGRMGGFPLENLEKAIMYGTSQTKQVLRDAGIRVDEFNLRIWKKNEILDEHLNPSRRDEV